MKSKIITMAHGNGGSQTRELIETLFLKNFNNDKLGELGDSAVIENFGPGKLAYTTDSYIITPIFFPGGDIGKLAVAGTINDLAVSGAKPLYLTSGFIIEEGFKVSDLERIVISMKDECEKSGVKIVAGDTKVIDRGAGFQSGLFINTSGVGVVPGNYNPSARKIEPGDHILINGDLGDHGASLLIARNDFPIKLDLTSDCNSLNNLIGELLPGVKDGEIKIMRDITRGGLATVLNEFCHSSSFSLEIDERIIPVNDSVKTICEMTGFDPLYMANEGKVVIICSPGVSEKLIGIMKNNELGINASIIGEVKSKNPGKVVLKTSIGTSRIVDTLSGDMLPRIC